MDHKNGKTPLSQKYRKNVQMQTAISLKKKNCTAHNEASNFNASKEKAQYPI